jgi:hypothetical protein
VTREFPDKATAADLGDPATDPPLTYRVHPDDDPRDPNARRVMKVESTRAGLRTWPWAQVTGPAIETPALNGNSSNTMVATWPYTNHTLASAAFRPVDEHRTFTISAPVDDLVVTCSCGTSAGHFPNRSAAGEWWQAHRRAVLGSDAQAAERGDLDERSFKGGAS